MVELSTATTELRPRQYSATACLLKIEAGKVAETVHLIDWKEPERNDFAIAEVAMLAPGAAA